MPICSGCNESLGREDFSKKQLSKKSSDRRCRACVEQDAEDGAVQSMKQMRDRLVADGCVVVDDADDGGGHGHGSSASGLARIQASDVWAASDRPAVKTVPRGFDTTEQAEEAGWRWSSLRHACNGSHASGTWCMYYDASKLPDAAKALGDLAICEDCTNKGETADSVVQKMGCAIQ